MFTLVGFQKSMTAVADVAQALTAIADQHITVNGNDVYVPALNKLIAEYAARTNTCYGAQLQSPSLRRQALLDLPIIQQGIQPSGNESFQPHYQSPITLDINEQLEAWLTDSGTSAIVSTVLAWLADDSLKPVNGAMISIGFQATITAIIGSWVNGALTFNQKLPVGKYQIVGASCKTASGAGIAFRFVIPGYQWRPGALCENNLGAKPYVEQLYGGMGVWGEFDTNTPPTLDILNSAAGSQAFRGYMNLIKSA